MITDVDKYYLYRHIRLDKNEPFYIGIGTKQNRKSHTVIYKRAYSKHSRGKIWRFIENKTNYKVEILLESNDRDFIKQKEIEFIKLYGRIDLGTGILANLTDGGDDNSAILNSKECVEKAKNTRRLIKEKRGYYHSEESRKLISKVLTNRKCTEETKIKLRLKAKLRENKGLDKALEVWRKPVIQLTKENLFICEYNSIIDAANKTNSSFKLISMVCKGKRKTHNGFKWVLKKDYNK